MIRQVGQNKTNVNQRRVAHVSWQQESESRMINGCFFYWKLFPVGFHKPLGILVLLYINDYNAQINYSPLSLTSVVEKLRESILFFLFYFFIF